MITGILWSVDGAPERRLAIGQSLRIELEISLLLDRLIPPRCNCSAAVTVPILGDVMGARLAIESDISQIFPLLVHVYLICNRCLLNLIMDFRL